MALNLGCSGQKKKTVMSYVSYLGIIKTKDKNFTYPCICSFYRCKKRVLDFHTYEVTDCFGTHMSSGNGNQALYKMIKYFKTPIDLCNMIKC